MIMCSVTFILAGWISAAITITKLIPLITYLPRRTLFSMMISLIRGTIPEAYLPEQIKPYRYQKPQYHITGAEMRNHIDKSELVAI